MSRAKAWRRAALATYIAAGAALTLAGYTVATTAANANTLRDTRERIEDFQREQTAIAENSISAASVRRGTLPPCHTKGPPGLAGRPFVSTLFYLPALGRGRQRRTLLIAAKPVCVCAVCTQNNRRQAATTAGQKWGTPPR